MEQMLNLSFPLSVKVSEKSTSVTNASVGEDSSGGTRSCVEFHIWDVMQHKFSTENEEDQSEGSCKEVRPGIS